MLKISLASARVNAGYSQMQVAKLLHKDKGTIVNWEKGRSEIKISDFDALCKLYKISQDNIILPSTLQKVEKRSGNEI